MNGLLFRSKAIAILAIAFSTHTAAQERIAPMPTMPAPIQTMPPMPAPMPEPMPPMPERMPTMPAQRYELPSAGGGSPPSRMREIGDGDCKIKQPCSEEYCSPPSVTGQTYRQCLKVNCGVHEENCLEHLIKSIKEKMEEDRSDNSKR
jgi:hypothetical protein